MRGRIKELMETKTITPGAVAAPHVRHKLWLTFHFAAFRETTPWNGSILCILETDSLFFQI